MPSSVLIVNTIADLASIDNTYSDLVIVNDNERTSGNTFQWVSSATANGGTIYAGSSGFWQMMYEGPVSVKWFGAKGMGNPSIDETSEFQAAVNFILQVGGTLFIPRGTYFVSNIQVSAPYPRFNLIGEGQDVSIIQKYDNATTDPIFSFSGIVTVSPPSIEPDFENEIANLTVNSFGVNRISGFELTNYARFNFRNVKAINCNIGFDCKGVLIGSFFNCTAKSNNRGFNFERFELSGQYMYNNMLAFYSCNITSNKDYGICFDNGSMISLFSCDFEANGTSSGGSVGSSGAVLFKSGVADEYGSSIITLRNCWFEKNYGGYALTSEAPNSYAPSFFISTCNFIDSEGGREIYLDHANRVYMEQVEVLASGGTVNIDTAQISNLFSCIINQLIDTSVIKNHFNSNNNGEYGWATDVQISNGSSLKLTWANGSGVNEIASDIYAARMILKPDSENPCEVRGNVWCRNSVGVGGTYNSPHIMMGDYHLWVDNGKLMIKHGQPTSNTDGTIVGTQT